jgi:hypothetical protein
VNIRAVNINQTTFRPLSLLKSAFVRPGRKPRHIPWGLYSGLTLDLDLTIETQIYLGLWERETYPWLRSALPRCRWLIDVGAAKGELSILLATRPGVTRVVACEPLAREVDILRANMRLNATVLKAPIDIVQKFVSTAVHTDTIALDCLGVDRTCPGLVKIDVDGAEMDVLRSGPALLKSGAATLLIETHSKVLESECLAFLTAHNYRCRIIRNGWWRIVVPEQRVGDQNRWLWAQPCQILSAD